MAQTQNEDIAIKFEASTPPNFDETLPSALGKRRSSAEHIDPAEKRQRIETPPAQTHSPISAEGHTDTDDLGDLMGDGDFDLSFINNIAASVPQKSPATETNNTNRPESAPHNGNAGTSWTPANIQNAPQPDIPTLNGNTGVPWTAASQIPIQNGNIPPVNIPPQPPIQRSANSPPAMITPHDANLLANDPQLSIEILSLPILESLSIQILAMVSDGPYEDICSMVVNTETPRGKVYQTLKGLFDTTKKIYRKNQSPFLSANDLNIQDYGQRAIIRIANLATFVASTFGGQDIGFYELDGSFIDCWTPEGVPLSKASGQLLLNLKTQIYVAEMSEEEKERSNDLILKNVFPTDDGNGIFDTLARRHPDFGLTADETQFVKDVKERKEYLLAQEDDPVRIKELGDMFHWDAFLRSAHIHMGSYKPFVGPYMEKNKLTVPARPSLAHTTNGNGAHQDTEDYDEAERAANQVLKGYGIRPDQYQAPNDQTSYPPQQQQSQQTYAPSSQQSQANYRIQFPSNGAPPHPTQSESTSALYDKARQAAAAKNNHGQKARPGLPSQRRPWTGDEENALMAGLDSVKGPHWSQILALYGPKGQVSDILKDRNQVQLKDKARNLKLFFLKSNIEVPYYLQCVTGELKTRAPSQAARKEAEERARLAGEEESARWNGVMALAGGMNGLGGGGGGGAQMNGQNGNGNGNGNGSSSGNGTPYSNTHTETETDNNNHSDGSSPERFQVVEPTSQAEERERSGERLGMEMGEKAQVQPQTGVPERVHDQEREFQERQPVQVQERVFRVMTDEDRLREALSKA